MSPQIVLKFFPLNHAWAFTFGDSMLRISDDAPLFFMDRKAALHEADQKTIAVAEDGTCFTKVRTLPDCFTGAANA
jgi:hypothetical protein